MSTQQQYALSQAIEIKEVRAYMLGSEVSLVTGQTGFYFHFVYLSTVRLELCSSSVSMASPHAPGGQPDPIGHRKVCKA